ncbi:MAG: lipid-binding domain protein [Ferruginibacter sp.]|nr:lipid-binding domain protein [Ferruginibacter sp.]
MRFLTSSIIFILCLFFQLTAVGQEDWILKKDKNGIKVYSRKVKNAKFNEIKVECEFEGRLSQLAAVLFDVNKQYQWVYKTAKSQLLKEISPADVFFYSEIECPWPFDNRDLVVRMILTQNAATKVMTIEAKNVDKFIPDKRNMVRIKYSRANWTVTPLNNHRFKVDYRLQIDPGEGAPAWLLNLFSTDGPYESFRNLKERIKLPQYQHAKFPFVVD